MTSPDELRSTLQRLAGHLAVIHDDLETDGLHSARTSQTGVRGTTTGSRLPCSAVTLDYLITDVSPRIRGWCTYLQQSAHITGLPDGWAPLNVWVAFLARNREKLLDQSWADEAVEELGKLEEELRHRLNPADPNQVALMASIAQDRKDTARNIARMLSASMGKRVDRHQVMYLSKSGRVPTYSGKDGETHYSLVEVRDALESWQDRRMKKDV